MIPTTQFLKTKNIRVTPQRIAVYKILKEAHKHLSVEEIHSRIKRTFPRVSLGTIYAILEFFKHKKLIQEIRIKHNKACFDIRTDLHPHFLCRKCGKIFDVIVPHCSILKDKKLNGHLIENFQGYFYGICKWCAKGKKEK